MFSPGMGLPGVRTLPNFWRDLSVSKKLYWIVGSLAVLVACELFTLYFAMSTLSSVRAFVQGEGLWSKAQKSSVYYLQRYGLTRNAVHYRTFVRYLEVPKGYHRARVELEKSIPDFGAVRLGFLAGKLHRDDIDGVVNLFRRFRRVSYISDAIEIWTQADVLIGRLEVMGRDLHKLKYAQFQRAWELLGEIDELDRELTELEDRFSETLGAGSRWLEQILMIIVALTVLTVEATGLTVTAITGRGITKGIDEISSIARKVEQGDFSQRAPVRSGDELGRLAKTINQMTEALQRNVEGWEAAVLEVHARDEFMSIASHELKTPLTVLALQLQLLERKIRRLPEKAVCEPIEPVLRNSQKQTTRLSTLIDDLLDLTRIRSGRFDLNPENFELGAMVRDLASRLEPAVSQFGSSLTVDARQPVTGRWDRGRLEQVLTNLISNAAKYGRGQPIHVTIDAEGGKARIMVKDNGLGLATSEQDKIFDRFERASSDRKISGLGLGLYITRMIIEAQGGRIWVESKIGEGATFAVEIPLIVLEATLHAQAAPVVRDAGLTSRATQSLPMDQDV